MSVKNRPRLGQHFLTSEAYRRRVASALPIAPDDLVLEIGPGRGAMTPLLAERAAQVVAVELDARLAEGLRSQFAGEPKIEIVTGDVLDVDLAALCRRHGRERALVAGNLPYYLTSPILHHLMAAASHWSALGVVVQREVAERIAARPGSRSYGYLSVLMQSQSKPAIRFTIPPGAFSPPPEVQSALVVCEIASAGGETDQERRGFLEFAKLAFARKRKTLVNNLARTYTPVEVRAAFERLGLAATARAEELSAAELRRLFAALARPPAEA